MKGQESIQETAENNTEIADFGINADDNAAGTTHMNDPIQDENEIEKLQAQLQEQKDKYLRLIAEFDNYRKRTAKEFLDIRQTAGKEIIVSLLDIMDDCDRAEKQMDADNDIHHVKEGVQLIFNKLRSTLYSKGVKAMESIKSEFDVELHEAITEVPAPSKDLKGKVVDEIQKGYYLNDKIIRFAKVVVGK